MNDQDESEEEDEKFTLIEMISDQNGDENDDDDFQTVYLK